MDELIDLNEQDRAQDAPVQGRAEEQGAGEPWAVLVWNLLRDRSVADKALALQACDRRLGRKDMPIKQEQAAYAIALFVEAEGHIPHATEWDAWRCADPSRQVLPSARFVRNAFGGWKGLRAALGSEPTIDITSKRLVARESYRDEDLLACLRAWAARETGPLRRYRFAEWLQAEGPARAGISRAPTSPVPFRRFGRRMRDWLQAAGVQHAQAPRAAPSAGDGGVQQRRALMVELTRWADAQPSVLTRQGFLAHLRTTPFPEGHPLRGVRPHDAWFRQHFADWEQALAGVGLDDRVFGRLGVHLRSVSPNVPVTPEPVYSTDWTVLGSWVRLAASQLTGAGLSVSEYTDWRRRRLECAQADGRELEAIPSASKLKQHAEGSWYLVKIRAGVPGLENLAPDQVGRITYTREEVVAALQAARAAFLAGQTRPDGVRGDADRFADQDYCTWRAAEVCRRRQRGEVVRIPVPKVVRKVLCGDGRASWIQVLQALTLIEHAEQSQRGAA